jgi:glycosyltransferase involved in cell wall biosynthesis
VQKRIALFQANWPFQVHTANSVIELAQSGYQVDLFLYNTPMLYDIEDLKKWNNIHILLYSDLDRNAFWNLGKEETQKRKSVISLLKGGMRRAVSLFRSAVEGVNEKLLLWQNSSKGILPSQVIKESFRVIKDNAYKGLIGVEKCGLIWAGQLGKAYNIPVLYHSLELYTFQNQNYKAGINLRIKILEKSFHQNCAATIIQDDRRANILLGEHELEGHTILEVPVSLRGGHYDGDQSYIEEKFGIGKDQVTILEFGMISEGRFSLPLVKIAQSFPENWKMIIHGWGYHDFIAKLKEANQQEKVIFSLDRLAVSEIPQLISSVHIGLVLYSSSDPNNYYTGFSSEKLALYLQCGIPVIAFRYESYEHLEKHGAGALIDNLEEIPQAIERIMKDYHTFRENAFECFKEFYDFSKNFKKVIAYLDKV